MKKQRGFSMVEALISIALILIAGFALIKLIPAAKMGLKLSENHVYAAYLGRSLINEAQMAGFNNIAPVTGTVEYKGVNDGAPFSQVFSYKTELQTTDTDKKYLWATITWHETTGDKKVVLETIVVNPK